MRRLTALAALTLLPLSPAHATVPKVGSCPFLTAERPSTALGVDWAPDLRIVSADLASGKKTVSFVLRVGATPGSGLAAQLGEQWHLGFTIGGRAYRIALSRSPGPSGTWSGDAGFAIKTGRIEWTLPRTAIPELARRGQVFRNFTASTWTTLGAYDTATTTRTYVDRSRGCIPAS